MSMLSRYQKAGGFMQLLQLIETTGKQKQENFLNIIEKEDARWASAIKEKMLTMEKILAWEDSILAEIAARLQMLTLATALHGLKQEDCDRLLKTMSHSQKRNIDDLKKSKAPNPAEISAAFLKILQETRSMITQGYIKLEKFAPHMAIPEDVEENLKSSFSPPAQPAETPAAELVFNVPTQHPSGGNDNQELNTLKSKMTVLNNENNQLKAEVKILRDKLAQIRKIA